MLFHLYYFQYLLFLCLYCHLILAFTNWKISNWKQINVIPSNPSSSSSSSITTFTTRSFSLICYNNIHTSSSSNSDISTNVILTSGNKNFITNIIENDIEQGMKRIITRFPPEPNGYLHLGHAKSICLNFGVAKTYQGFTNMRFDDTNPVKEDMEYVRSILEDVQWLTTGQTNAEIKPWKDSVRHASDYFTTFYEAAIFLIRNNLAYVDDLSPEDMKLYRGTLTEPGKDSPFRTRSIDENLDLFMKMKNGEFPDGKCVLRAKIDNSSPNLNLRDPTIYRIKHATHPITGDQWCIYPMYDYAHAISDAMEEITHSLCTLEFEDHRPLYEWVINSLKPSHLLPKDTKPKQIEFSRLNLQYTILSKRKLIQLVNENHVTGWDDPRMPTICGLRRRGYPPEAIRLFCDRIGISKAENNIDILVLEECVREVLDDKSFRAFAVLNPLKVTITNWDDDKVEYFDIDNHPKKPELGKRTIPFTRELYIDADDFFDCGIAGELDPPKGYKRLTSRQGNNIVRLKNGYVIECNQVIRDPITNEVLELQCTYDERTKGGVTPEGAKKAKGIIQWVSTTYGIQTELRLYDRLFQKPSPGKETDNFLDDINPDSIRIHNRAVIEPSLQHAKEGAYFQFERVGYFTLDKDNNRIDKHKHQAFNRIVTLKDSWISKP